MQKARRVVRKKDWGAYVGLQESQIEDLQERKEFPIGFPVYEGGRAVILYEDQIASWQRWRDARGTGETKLTWVEWEAQHADQERDPLLT